MKKLEEDALKVLKDYKDALVLTGALARFVEVRNTQTYKEVSESTLRQEIDNILGKREDLEKIPVVTSLYTQILENGYRFKK